MKTTSSQRLASRSRLHRLDPLFFFAIFCLLPPVGYVIHRLAAPSDGARLSETRNTFTAEGAVVSPYDSVAGPLREGDVIVSVAEVPVETWARAVFTGGLSRPDLAIGRTVDYEILRGDERLAIDVPLVRLPWQEILAERWGALLFVFVSQAVAAFVFLNRRNDPAARALFIWAMSGSHIYAWSVFLQVGDLLPGGGFWLFHASTPLLWLIYWPASTHVALVFPRPLPIIARRRLLVPGLYAASFTLFATGAAWALYRTRNILAWQNALGEVETAIAGLFLVVTMVFIVLQHRRTRSGVERQQIRWAIFGALISGVGGLILWIAIPLLAGRSVINANFMGLLVLPFPLSLALAIWRHRLFDIDLIIRRTLQYSLTTLLLAGLYFAGVILLQNLVRSLAGDPDAPLITVLTTLGIAALFNPLRRRVQEFIDRRFFRTSYNAEQILDHFAAAARDEVDLEVLSVALMGVVDETMQPQRISLWLG
ncbi:MAG TPA: hypothetical protein VMN57_03020 [Anaerolineales bacterium]|nr:hypothetical protein [Anaerolineales bacterium]